MKKGRRKINKITRYVSIGIGAVLALGYYMVLRNQGALIYTNGLEGFFAGLVIIVTFVAGTLLLMWMGEQIDKKEASATVFLSLSSPV